jgi:predicted dehydrogenase
VDADDNTAFVVRFASGALGSIHISYTAANDIGEQVIAAGSEGVLAIHDDGRLYGSRHGERATRMQTGPADAVDPGATRHVRSFSILAGEWVWAMRSGTDASPSFEDGAKVQEVIDAVTRSQQLNRWIDLSGNKWPV